MEAKMIQVKLAPLPVSNGVWAAHFQYGKFGDKEDGDYKSGQCLLTQEQAIQIMRGGRTTSFRFSSAEAYFVEDQDTYLNPSGDLYFGGCKMPFNRQAVLDLLEKNLPINPDLQTETEPLLQATGAEWEKKHRDFAAIKEGKAPQTLMH
jgi:hypothetical protein